MKERKKEKKKTRSGFRCLFRKKLNSTNQRNLLPLLAAMKLVVKHGGNAITMDDIDENASAAVRLLGDDQKGSKRRGTRATRNSTRCDSDDFFFSTSSSQQDLSALLVQRTGVLARQQKLVFKGKVLTGNPSPLSSLGVKEGGTLLLLAAAPTAGAVASAAATGLAAAAAAAKRQAAAPAAAAAAATAAAEAPSSRITEARVRAWVATGVVGLRGEGLSTLPEALFVAPPPPSSSSSSSSSASTAASSSSPLAVARAVDLGENRLSCLPERFVEAATTSTSKLSRLRLAGNALRGPTALPASFARLAALEELVLDDNPLLRSLPPSVFSLPRLRRLSAARCGLGELSTAVSNAKSLSELVLAGNELETLPAEIGGCSSLSRLDAGGNRISTLPENSLARCERLAVLRLDGNRLATLPKDLFGGAKALHTLGLRGNEVTLDKLREAESWREFEARRVKAADARLAGRVDVAGGKGGGAFDATADAEEWIKW